MPNTLEEKLRKLTIMKEMYYKKINEINKEIEQIIKDKLEE